MKLLPVIDRGKKVLAAVSGGSDSVALLLLLLDQRDKGLIELCAAHLNHSIRGSESDRDEAFVKDLCKRLNVPLACARIDVPRICRESKRGIETVAREERRVFLDKARRDFRADVIATAHHLDDQAETVLMHIFRGGGVGGASGINPKSDLVVRPLLSTPKSEILAFLESRNQDYCEDSTNAFDDTPRNFLRHEVMPRVLRWYPAANTAIGRFSDIAREEDAFLRRATEKWMEENVFITPYGFILADKGDKAILRRAVVELTGSGYEGVERVMDSINSKMAAELPGWRVEFAKGRAFFIGNGYSPNRGQVALKDKAGLSGIGFVRIEISDPRPSSDAYSQVLDMDKLKGATIRTRRRGDVMKPLGAPGTRKLKDILIDKGVARAHRDCTALIAKGDRILWIPGVCIDEEVKLTQSTKNAARLIWEREDLIPWRKKC